MYDAKLLRSRIYSMKTDSLAPKSNYQSTKDITNNIKYSITNRSESQERTKKNIKIQQLNKTRIDTRWNQRYESKQSDMRKHTKQRKTNSKIKTHKQKVYYQNSNMKIENIKKIKNVKNIDDHTLNIKVFHEMPQQSKNKNENLLKKIIDKENLLRQLQNRISYKIQEKKKIEEEFTMKFAVAKLQLMNIEKRIKSEKQKLISIQTKLSQYEKIYDQKVQEIKKGRQDMEMLVKYVQQKSSQNQKIYQQITRQKVDLESKSIQLTHTHQIQLMKEAQLKKAQTELLEYRKEITLTVSDLQNKIKRMQEDSQKIEKIKSQQFLKQIQLKQKQRIIQGYVSQLTSCVSNLTIQRSNLLNINNDLQQRCSQLQNLQIKLFQKISEPAELESNFPKYLSEIKNSNKQLEHQTPLKRKKQNIVNSTEKKFSRKIMDKSIVEQTSSQLLENLDPIKIL